MSSRAFALLILASDGRPVRRYGVDQYSAHSRGGSHNDPGKIVTAAGIEDSSRQPRRKPLTERISHDDQRQELSQRRQSKAVRRNQWNQHVVGAHGKAEKQRESPHGGRL